MKISEQAQKAAEAMFYHDDQKRFASEEIQTAINDHERDLVEAAKEFMNWSSPEWVPVQFIQAMQAALDRRKEK